LLSLSLGASAEQVTDLQIFKNDTKADADEVNSNFSKLQKAVNTNDLKGGGTMNGPLTVPAITYEPPKQGSVTYSAMGFTPETNISFSWYRKSNDDGSLAASASADNQCTFYHSLMLRSGITITRIQSNADGKVTVKLKQEKSDAPVAEIPSSDGDNEDDGINHKLEFAKAYYIEVSLSDTDQKFYSVTIEYTYTEP
jgi:hypothetical protein